MKMMCSVLAMLRRWLDLPFPNLAGARVYFNDPATGEPLPVFFDREASTLQTRPVILDLKGETHHCFIDPYTTYQVTVEDYEGRPLMQFSEIEGWRLAAPVVREDKFGIGTFKAYK